MRLVSLLLLLLLATLASPARAQTLDPALVGTWEQTRIRVWPVSKESRVVTTTLTFAPDGRSVSSGVRQRLHEAPWAFETEVVLTTEGNRLIEVPPDGRAPTVEEVVRYRIEGDRLFITAETWAEGDGVHTAAAPPRRLVGRVVAAYRRVEPRPAD